MEKELPDQLKRQLDQAAAIERQMLAPASAPPSGNTEVADELASPADEQLQATSPTPPAVTPTEVPEDTWQQKYHVLYGKYQAEVPRLHAQVKELSAQMAEVLAASKAPPPAPEPSVVTKADEEAFGQDLINLMRRISDEKLQQLDRKVDRKVDERVVPLAERVVQSETQRFWGAVKAAAPDFDQIDQDPRWFQYLDRRIPGTRATYRAAAEAAVNAHDVDSLLEVVNGWKQSVTPPPAPPGAAPSKAQAELQRQVAPTSRKAQEPPAQAKVYTGADFQYWNDPRRRHDTDAAEVARMVAELDRALEERRIRW